jgi:poly(rC)-binding protein 2/3/4
MEGKDVGIIIGKAGTTIKSIRETSGAKINISNGSSSERLVTITGSKDKISKAVQSICCKTQEDITSSSSVAVGNGLEGSEGDGDGCGNGCGDGSGHESAVSLKLIIPSTQCGSLIGKGGSKIKEIREITGSAILISSDVLPNSTERTVTISGSPEAITKCIRLVCDIIIENPPKGTPIQYKPHNQSTRVR